MGVKSAGCSAKCSVFVGCCLLEEGKDYPDNTDQAPVSLPLDSLNHVNHIQVSSQERFRSLNHKKRKLPLSLPTTHAKHTSIMCLNRFAAYYT